MKYSKRANMALVLFCSLLLIVPHMVELSDVSSTTASVEKRESVEKRKMASWPDSGLISESFSDYAAQFEKFYSDSFGLREELIRWNNRLRLLLFAESPIPGVRLGREGWLFYADEWALEEYENVMPFKTQDLEKIREITRERLRWLEHRGIKLFILVVPNKTTIYSEYLPPEIHRIGSQSRLDQLSDHLRSDPGIEFIDLRNALLKAKPEKRLYHLTDSHWNDYGALIGYATLMDHISRYFPSVRRSSVGDFTVSAVEGRGGDLAEMLSLDDVIREERITVSPSFVPTAKDGSRPYPNPADTVVYPGRDMVVKETNDPHLSKALVFRDSFASALIPFLAESFQSVVFVWIDDFLPELIDCEKPDLIIFECAERRLDALARANPPELRN